MITLTVNGRAHQVDVDPDTPLLYVLRNDLGLNGAKFGCGLGQCGACTVLVDDKPVFSCLVPVAALGERKVRTLEGLGRRRARPLPAAFEAEQAAQCGYCIAGMIMRAQALLERNAAPDRGGDARPHGAQPLPLRHPHAHPARGAPRRRGDGRRRARRRGGRAMSALDADARLARPRRAGRGLRAVAPARARRTHEQEARLPGDLAKYPVLDSWIRVDADGHITVFTGKAELGQGIKTALIQVAARRAGGRAGAHRPGHRRHRAHARRGRHRRQPFDAGQRHRDPQRRRQRARAAGRGGGVALRDRRRAGRAARRRGARARRPTASATASWPRRCRCTSRPSPTCRAARRASA